MKRNSFAVAAVALVLLSCHSESPTSPITQTVPPPVLPPVATTGMVWGYVYQTTGSCLLGATVEIVDGPHAGARSIQNECQGSWDYGDAAGYSFRDVPADVNVRLRASKEGYRTQEITVHPTAGTVTQWNFTLENP